MKRKFSTNNFIISQSANINPHQNYRMTTVKSEDTFYRIAFSLEREQFHASLSETLDKKHADFCIDLSESTFKLGDKTHNVFFDAESDNLPRGVYVASVDLEGFYGFAIEKGHNTHAISLVAYVLTSGNYTIFSYFLTF